jgi:hypothetical protein
VLNCKPSSRKIHPDHLPRLSLRRKNPVRSFHLGTQRTSNLIFSFSSVFYAFRKPLKPSRYSPGVGSRPHASTSLFQYPSSLDCKPSRAPSIQLASLASHLNHHASSLCTPASPAPQTSQWTLPMPSLASRRRRPATI